MTRSIAHRGPDDEGFFVENEFGLGVRRLSIIDLDGGSQPISNEDGTLWIGFNGEIYNYRALRVELEQRGHHFTTNSDTEVVLHLYEDRGPDCVSELRGMFSFAIWDMNRHELFLARDRLGQKPIFYSHFNGVFQFGSEIKSLLAAGDLPRDLDYESLSHYLSLRFIPPPATMFKQIKKLPPAHYLIHREGSVQVSRYWDVSFEEKLAIGEDELLDGLREKLTETVAAHLVSDVPVGAFLSGGMDSSMIVALMAGQINEMPNTFAIGVDNQQFNELPHARSVADHIGTQHHEEWVRADLIHYLPEMIWHLDEPSDPIAACMYFAARLASRHVKVVLGGDGGDELFAGFDRYRGMQYSGIYSWIPTLVREKLIGPALSSVPEDFGYKSWTQRARWFHQIGSGRTPGDQYAAATTYFRFREHEKLSLFAGAAGESLREVDSSAYIRQTFEAAPANSLIDRMLYTDLVTRLPEHSLMLTDRMTMAHGLEARSPFLDHELVAYLAQFPSNLKIRNGELKAILRELAQHYLPQSILERPKQGFMFPIAHWFRDSLYPLLLSTLPKSAFVSRGVFNGDYIETLIEEHRNSRQDHHVRLWMLLNLEIWHRIYIEGESPASVHLTEPLAVESLLG